ncbi:MAG TPA: hypothetical protein VFN35_35470 [Ktedonobacteraceae bacterium]|nr:hypothetical protein [Ktedonobacteraceae bacterium]
MDNLREALLELPELNILCQAPFAHCQNKAVLYYFHYLCPNCALTCASYGPAARRQVEEAIEFKRRYPGATAKCHACENPARAWCANDGVPICQMHTLTDAEGNDVCTTWCAQLPKRS